MNFWEIMNFIAWGLCGLFAFLIIKDVIKTEKEFRRVEEDSSEVELMCKNCLTEDLQL